MTRTPGDFSEAQIREIAQAAAQFVASHLARDSDDEQQRKEERQELAIMLIRIDDARRFL